MPLLVVAVECRCRCCCCHSVQIDSLAPKLMLWQLLLLRLRLASDRRARFERIACCYQRRRLPAVSCCLCCCAGSCKQTMQRIQHFNNTHLPNIEACSLHAFTAAACTSSMQNTHAHLHPLITQPACTQSMMHIPLLLFRL